MEFRIRRANAADARAIARVHVESWRSTYAGIVPAEFLASLSVDKREEMWGKMLADEDELMFLAEDETGVFGFACGGKLREALDSYDAELFAIYLLRQSQGKGAGRSLFQALTRSLRAAGYSGMVLWVLKDNPAVKFYEQMGGKQIAKKPIEIGSAQLEEVAFGWPRLENVILNETAANGPT
jgi:ribosomal protein S18 acetylase RimI-like enzyme